MNPISTTFLLMQVIAERVGDRASEFGNRLLDSEGFGILLLSITYLAVGILLGYSIAKRVI